ncbi:hypothetical protein B296_00013498 [Ensete ventricosum]|uniref:Uncharacterized protein n=1 Tax=Ensete ventricosum TaxID=4639 RepID=A0A427AR88_ENSVE|nr:hypothetical protein B296_00013498 [Ensete ventricosum]
MPGVVVPRPQRPLLPCNRCHVVAAFSISQRFLLPTLAPAHNVEMVVAMLIRAPVTAMQSLPHDHCLLCFPEGSPPHLGACTRCRDYRHYPLFPLPLSCSSFFSHISCGHRFATPPLLPPSICENLLLHHCDVVASPSLPFDNQRHSSKHQWMQNLKHSKSA